VVARRSGKTPAGCRRYRFQDARIVRAWGAAVLRPYTCSFELLWGWMRIFPVVFQKGDEACSFWKPKGRELRYDICRAMEFGLAAVG
jgi:hypothetical protein